MDKLNYLKKPIQEMDMLFKKEKEVIERAFGGELLDAANSSYEEIYRLFKEIKTEVKS